MPANPDAADGSEAAAETQARATVSLADFDSVECEAPLSGSRSVFGSTISGRYQSVAKEASDAGREREARVYQLLSAIAHMHFKPEDRAEPYGPLLVMGGRRSMIPSDLHAEESDALAAIAPRISNPALRALLADIAWLNDRSRAASARLAINSFCEAVRLLAEGTAELFDGAGPSSRPAVDMLRRACQIAASTGWKEPEAGGLKAQIASITGAAYAAKDERGFLEIGALNADYRVSAAASVASQAEKLSAKSVIDPLFARDLLQLAARAHLQNGNEAESNRCLAGAAERYVDMAASAGFKGMLAANFLSDAIRDLRAIPGTKERRQELEAKLREAQASIMDEMGAVAMEVDLSDVADQARKTVSGLTLAQALAQFARLASSPSPDDLRKEGAEAAQKSLLSGIPAAYHDEEGKMVAKSPGLFGDGDDQDEAMRYLIARHESFRRQTASNGAIDPTRQLIQSQHPLSVRDFLPLAELSPFVPSGHECIFALGFARFFGGDYISAVHLLVPQLENSLRHVLKLEGTDPSMIRSDMTQENRTLSVMLEKDRDVLEKIFGPAIVFEIDNLFDFRGGPALRHSVAHGFVPAGECFGSDAIYACWFILRLCVLPLLPHWKQVTEVYERR